MSSTIAYSALVAFIWVTFAYKLYTLHWHVQDTVQRAYICTHLLVSLAFTVLSPPIYLAVDHLTGVPNAARLLGNCLGVVGGWFFQPVTTQLIAPTRQGRVQTLLASGWAPTATIVALVVLFNRASLPVSAPLDFQTRYSTAPFMAPYRLVLLLYVALVAGRVFLASLRNREIIEQNPRPYRRVQSRLQTVGWGFCVGYAVQESAFIALSLLGLVPPHAYPVVIANVLLTGGVLLLLSSAFFDGWYWITQYRTNRRLYRLWRDQCAAAPSIALDPPRSALIDALNPRDISLRVYRRVTEIRDGIITLQPYVDEAVAMAIRDRLLGRMTARHNAALADAVTLHMALSAKRSEQIAANPSETPLVPPGMNFENEVQILEQTAIAYRRVEQNPLPQPLKEDRSKP